jgi:hypothetical protein
LKRIVLASLAIGANCLAALRGKCTQIATNAFSLARLVRKLSWAAAPAKRLPDRRHVLTSGAFLARCAANISLEGARVTGLAFQCGLIGVELTFVAAGTLNSPQVFGELSGSTIFAPGLVRSVLKLARRAHTTRLCFRQ